MKIGFSCPNAINHFTTFEIGMGFSQWHWPHIEINYRELSYQSASSKNGPAQCIRPPSPYKQDCLPCTLQPWPVFTSPCEREIMVKEFQGSKVSEDKSSDMPATLLLAH